MAAVDEKDPEEVVLKATGKAIEKALNLGLFFQGQEDCKVRIRTGSVAAIDDIVPIGTHEQTGKKRRLEEHQRSPAGDTDTTH
ncbi:hypothetical protein LTR16_009311 [Cryomyces antarcticus]|uniref:Uncharacterized protein n=1 Tax=Cryomyces antarcticus TaxID=329879 RepID=A0ABR0JTC4_9PEZI|nr:hypothetical protein LTR16_009311 [Cryomyces antarcticus]